MKMAMKLEKQLMYDKTSTIEGHLIYDESLK